MSIKMMLLVLVCGLTACLFAVTPNPFNYETAWKEIGKLQNDRLPKSMETKVDSLYEAAIIDKKIDQQIKALVYKLTIQQQIEEFSSQKAITLVQAKLAEASLPAAAIMHSMLAQLYWGYYQGNRWRYSQRSATINYVRDDIATWDLDTIVTESIRQYQLSLREPLELQKFNIADYPALVFNGGAVERLLRPTLYDFLAHRALDFYVNDESGLILPPEEFSITDTKYFQPAAGFVNMIISTPDTLSLKYQAALLYQDLISFHLDDADPSALIEVDLDRLDFVCYNCKLPNRDEYYEAALRLKQSKDSTNPASAYATFKLASLYYSLAGKYKPTESEDYRWHYKLSTELCREAVTAFPNSFGGQSCIALDKQITIPVLNMVMEQFVLPQTPNKVLLSVKNLSGVKLSVYKIPYPSLLAKEYSLEYLWDRNGQQKVKELMDDEPYWSNSFPINNEGDYRVHSYELPVTALPMGNYIIIAANDGDEPLAHNSILGYSLFNSTEISYLAPNKADKSILIANRNTGLPIRGATILVYNQTRTMKDYTYQLYWSGTSNPEGIIKFDYKDVGSYLRMSISSGADTLQILDYYAQTSQTSNYPTSRCLLFTDRSFYRPGQSIYVKGVFYETNGGKHNKLLPIVDVYVSLRDANQQEIARHSLKTNEYGTFNCMFTAPQGVLTGNMTIQTQSGSASFSVEEYKRPKFEVSLDKPKESYKLNQYVTVKGKALSYAGVPVDNATVSYRIYRQPKYPYWYWWWGASPDTPQKEIAKGKAVTDSNGDFSLTFLASGDESALFKYNPYFTYTVSVDVTDINGETRSRVLALNIGEQELILNPELADNIDSSKRRLAIPIKTTNLSNEPIAVKGTIAIKQLKSPANMQRKRVWDAPDRNYLEQSEYQKLFPNDIYGKEGDISTWQVLRTVHSSSFNTKNSEPLVISDIGTWKPGTYLLEATATYKQQEVKVSKYFTVYNSSSHMLPYPKTDWFVPVKTTCEPGENAVILIGSGYSGVSVLYEVEKDHAIVESKRISLNGNQRLITIPVEEKDRGSFYVHFTFVRDNRLYTHAQEITVPWTNKQLTIEYMTFRNKLLPGQKEEWRLKLNDHTGGKVTAEVLSSMYDASLDAFRNSQWTASVYGKVSKTCGWSNRAYSRTIGLRVFAYPYYYSGIPERRYDSFNWYSYYYNVGYYRSRMVQKDRIGSARQMDMSDNLGTDEVDMVAYDKAISQIGNIYSTSSQRLSATLDDRPLNFVPYDTPPAVPGLGNTPHPLPQENLSTVQARTNFAETAFFYPELRTDENGEVSFVFTVPEALTRWKFRALALSKDFQIGTTENTTVTQKPLMVIPNAPRFFREGDKITFSSKLSCLEDTDISGNCQLFLFDALSMEPVDKSFGLNNAQQPFTIKKGESTVLSWNLSIPFDISAVTYRVVAKAGDFSDGEESTLPILSNRMLVTESLPLPVSGNSTKSFEFKKLKDSGSSSTIKNHKLTLEYTSNPAWYAVQALPYLMEYPYECNEQIFSRFYANSLATHIANSNPRIKKVFESWRDTPNSTALLSNLEKNQELKAVLLQETPWVMDAKNESQSKQRIGLLFDLNTMANQYSSALAKLQKNQNTSGAWSWWQGMQDSWWVTQYIVEGFGHLDKLGVKAIRNDPKVWAMVQPAIRYLDKQILLDYEYLKKHSDLDLDHLGYMEMHYLYTRSFFKDVAIPEDVRVAVQYFQTQADKFWQNKDNFGQGLIALARHRDGNKVTPAKIIASLKECALHNEEMGMWWKNDGGWFWYQAPIETQSLMIEAFSEIGSNTASVDEMRTWLLKQKQTTNWKTTKATAEACYALLISGTEWLNTEELAEITIGGSKLDPYKLDGASVEAGTGYFKTSWSGSDISPQMAQVTVSNPNRVSSWGALYWQYFENLDKITPAETPLKLNKKLFIERITDTGKVLDPVNDKSQLSIGDRVIVRIELRSDRDMEYVHMKDMRSAGFEPINVLSRTKWQDGLVYYEATGDAATNFFIEYLRKGTYVFEYPLWVTNKGDFSNGITSIQCMYAPEFTAHSEGIRVLVK
ncbi:MAG: alpha-2-macroglobulin family protein [Candidatus Cloacimonetes bacterium]|nr:alpha-2-macroglobulin family protein [Candidatus Cloacimonadota bacterium]